MTDHQQAAIKALQEEVYVQLSGHYGDFNIPSEEEAESILTAAEPHLRRKWAEEINDLMPGIVYDTKNDFARGVKAGINYVLDILEGVGE